MKIEPASFGWSDTKSRSNSCFKPMKTSSREPLRTPRLSELEAKWNEFITWFLPQDLSKNLIVSKPPIQTEWCLQSSATGEHFTVNHLGWTMKGTVLTHDHRWLVHGSGKMLRAWRAPPPVPWLWALLAASIPWLILFAFRTYRRKRVRRANAGD